MFNLIEFLVDEFRVVFKGDRLKVFPLNPFFRFRLAGFEFLGGIGRVRGKPLAVAIGEEGEKGGESEERDEEEFAR